MAGRRRETNRNIPRDQHAAREVRRDVGEEIRSSAAKPLIRQPNRDHARGDRDRTGDHQDVGASRASDDEDGFDERS